MLVLTFNNSTFNKPSIKVITIALINNEARVNPFQVLVTQYCVDTTKNVPINRVINRIGLD